MLNRDIGLLADTNVYIPSIQLTNGNEYKNVQIIFFETNLGKKICYWYQLTSLIHNTGNFFSSVYDNHFIMEDFNLEPQGPP